MSFFSSVVLALLCGLLCLASVQGGATTIEWAEGQDGFWFDPLSWRDSLTGQPRIPTPDDSVLLPTFPLKHYHVYLNPIEEVVVTSLTVGSNFSDSVGCDNTTFAGETRAFAALIVRGASLTAREFLLVDYFGVLRFTSRPDGAAPLAGIANFTTPASTVTSALTTIRGWAQGCSNFVGDVRVDAGSKITLLTLFANSTIQYMWGKWYVEGDFTVELSTIFDFYIPADLSDPTLVSQIMVRNLTQVAVVYGRPRDPPVPVAGSEDLCDYRSIRPSVDIRLYGYPPSAPPSLFFYETFIGRKDAFWYSVMYPTGSVPTLNITTQRCIWYCYNPHDPQPYEEGPCIQQTAHSFSTLLGVSSSGIGCSCPPGTAGPFCSFAYCPGSPQCSGRGTCDDSSGTANCRCPDGWTGFACEIPVCPGSPACSGNGLCISASVSVPYCRCDANWTGPAGQPNDCSVPICSNNCTSPENGVCTAADTGVPHCQCKTGWALGPNLDCSLVYLKCPGRGGNQCTGHGSCNATSGICSCSAGWRGMDCSIPDCPGSPDCNHRGECVENSLTGAVECRCSAGWSGADCSVATCSLGTPCSGNGKCVDIGLDPPRCICGEGWTGENCSVPVGDCSALSHCDSESCVGSSSPYCTECEGNWRGFDCNAPYCLAANNFEIYPECSGHGSCTVVAGQPQCECRPGWVAGSSNDCATAFCDVGVGEEECSGHGTCSLDTASPICFCDAFFYGNSCSIFEAPCPGSPFACSGHGLCVNGTCQCDEGWRGEDCATVRCPGADENCNGHGTCDDRVTPAECRCTQYWKGDDCSTPVCPGDCSGNGRCSADTSPPQCVCRPYWSGADCSISQLGGGGSSSSSTTPYAVAGGAVGGGAVLLIVGVIAAYGVYKGMDYYKSWKINKSLQQGQVNFGEDDL